MQVEVFPIALLVGEDHPRLVIRVFLQFAKVVKLNAHGDADLCSGKLIFKLKSINKLKQMGSTSQKNHRYAPHESLQLFVAEVAVTKL